LFYSHRRGAAGITNEPDGDYVVLGKQLRSNRSFKMANINDSLGQLMTLDGGMAAALVDSNSGMVLGKIGSGVDLDTAGAGNTEVVKAKLKTMKALKLNDMIEDILITLGKQYHIIRPMARKPGLFVYLVLDKAKANLAMARIKTQEIETELAL
jgi:hypothetical protein